ncbi:SPOR domain-containing protein [Desulfosoma sp.]
MSRLKDRIHQYEEENEPRRLRVELTGVQAFVCVLVFFFSLTGVFVAGVLTGRGVSREARESATVQGTLYRLLGLRPAEEEPVDNASETWIPAEKILATLESEKELTTLQKPGPSKAAPTAPPASPTGKPSAPSSGGAETPNFAEQPPPLSGQEEPPETALPTPPASGSYALMVASMRRQENAAALLDRLKKKGHKAAMERIAVSDQDVWYRVILGGFNTRQKALEYAARLNKEEKLEAIVIRRESSGTADN